MEHHMSYQPPAAGSPPFTQPYQPQQPQKAPPAHDGMAIASLVLSILWLFGIGSVAAVIFGHRSRGKAKRGGRFTSGLATAGVVIGYIGIAGAVLSIALIATAASSLPTSPAALAKPSISAQPPAPVMGGQCDEAGLTADDGALTCGSSGIWQATGSSGTGSSGTSTSQAPAAPQYSISQQQAIDSAESYLSEGQGFSKAGLYQQLHSQYGEGFSARLARFAVNHVRVSWKHQAVLSARGYMQSEPGWSYSGLVQQLDSPDGEQFTAAQAEYAAKAVGL
jgi:hypothetical protein